VVEWQGRRLLRNTGPRGSAIEVALPEQLPDRFTIELEVFLDNVTYELAILTKTSGGQGLLVAAIPASHEFGQRVVHRPCHPTILGRAIERRSAASDRPIAHAGGR
jgi:hypothetical protein